MTSCVRFVHHVKQTNYFGIKIKYQQKLFNTKFKNRKISIRHFGKISRYRYFINIVIFNSIRISITALLQMLVHSPYSTDLPEKKVLFNNIFDCPVAPDVTVEHLAGELLSVLNIDNEPLVGIGTSFTCL